MDWSRCVSAFGILFMLAVAWALSCDRRRMNWRAILWGVGLQVLFALFVFVSPPGRDLFLWLNGAVFKVLDCAGEGTRFVFGSLADPKKSGFILVCQALPTIVFFSALMSILYYVRLMPLVIRGFAYVFTKLMRVSGAESLCTASNIFVGVESFLTVRPYLAGLTRSEICLLLTAGMATVASNVLAFYSFCLQEQFPAIAGHLISASILSAPAAIVCAKIMVPEDGRPATLGRDVPPYVPEEESVFVAVINGAEAGLKLIFGIVALLLAGLGLIALCDLLLGLAGSGVNQVCGIEFSWALKDLLGYLFYPFAWAIGVPAQDVGVVSRLLGERLVATEVKSYLDLAESLKNGQIQPRSAMLAAYALCGFAHFPSVAIFVGGLAALAPERKKDIAAMGLRALVAATLACLMTACMAGLFCGNDRTVLGLQ